MTAASTPVATAGDAAPEPFDAVDVIRIKRDQGAVPEDALRWMIDAYTREYVADSQMAAFAMAILLNGMSRDEIRVMTDAMIASGERMSFAGLGKRTVDKHSAGGVGDKITLLTNPKPSGKGNAIVQALAHAQGVATIVQDADLEYTPEQIPALIQPILDRKANVVYGTRFAHGYAKGMALPNKIVNKMLAWSVGILFFRSISDEATCYKAFRTDLLQAFDLQCRRFEFCPEATAKALRCNQKIMEIPIDYEPRSKEAGKKIRWFWTLFRYRFWNPVKAKSTLDRPGPEKPTSSEPN